MNKPNANRNKAIVLLRKLDPETFSYRVIGQVFDIKESTVYDICQRDWKKFKIPAKKGR
jgi:DNA-directed RNA polymerase specialized sigma24 family protein